MSTDAPTAEKPDFIEKIKTSIEPIQKFFTDEAYRNEKVAKWREADLEGSATLLQGLAEGKDAIKELLKGERRNGFPSHEKILEVKENAPHEVHLGISTEICKQAFLQKFPPDGKLPKIDELSMEFNLPKKQRAKGLPKSQTPGEPEIFIDVPNGATKEIFVVIRTNNNHYESKATIVVATVQLDNDGQPRWDGKEFDGRGVFATMTEKQFNERCKGTDDYAKWVRGETTTKGYTDKATVPVIENGHIVNKKLKQYWQEHDKDFTYAEKIQQRKNFEAAIVNLEQRRLERIQTRSTQMAEKTKRLAEELLIPETRIEQEQELVENLMIAMLTEYQIKNPKEPVTLEQIIATSRKLGLNTRTGMLEVFLRRINHSATKMGILKLRGDEEDENGLTIDKKTAELTDVQRRVVKLKTKKVIEE